MRTWMLSFGNILWFPGLVREVEIPIAYKKEYVRKTKRGVKRRRSIHVFYRQIRS